MELERPIVMASGCYDLIHAGHLEFLEEAKKLGRSLVVTIAGDKVLAQHKHRVAGLPAENRKRLVAGLKPVDYVIITDCGELGMDFLPHFLDIKPDYLAVTGDDTFAEQKLNLCKANRCNYVQLPKTPPPGGAISTTDIRRRINARSVVPLRVDFGGGWLDVPKLSRPGAYIVNCTIEPVVTLTEWPYEHNSGLGGSAAASLLTGRNAIETELATAGWQDPAVILETGCCIWASGRFPDLRQKVNPEFLLGRMALLWTGKPHRQSTGEAVDLERDYDLIAKAGSVAAMGVAIQKLKELARGVQMSYEAQVGEGMDPLPDAPCLARKYCGSGYGGYAVYIFEHQRTRTEWAKEVGAKIIEPYIRGVGASQSEI